MPILFGPLFSNYYYDFMAALTIFLLFLTALSRKTDRKNGFILIRQEAQQIDEKLTRPSAQALVFKIDALIISPEQCDSPLKI